jgi:predicted RNA-binding Zn-ribbon protein involved in translation (DUF1610 family)
MKKSAKKTERWVKVCSNCGSTNVSDRGMISREAYSNVNFCKSCGFQSVLFPEIPWEEAKKISYKPPKFNPSQAPIMPQQRWTINDIKKPGSIIGFILFLIIIFFLLFFG